MDAKIRPRTVSLARPSVGAEELAAVKDVLDSGWLTQGPKVAAFEKGCAERLGVPHALAVTSGTTALHVAIDALGIGPGDEVIVPTFTWVATANAAVYCGATPVFVDVEPDTYNIDAAKIAAAVTPRTRAIIPVHLFGLCADMDAVRKAVPAHVKIVEDAACAFGATYDGRQAGAMGDIGCFSFHPRKSITTGEGGMVVTRDETLARAMGELRNHGLSAADPKTRGGPGPHFMADVVRLGFNFRMSDIQAAVGVAQLAKLDRFIDDRERWAKFYLEALADVPWLALPRVPEGCRSVWQSFVVVVKPGAPKSRNAIMADLAAAGVATRPGTQAVTDLAYYRERHGIKDGQFPVATMLEAQSISLPLHNELGREDYEYVSEVVHSIC